MELREHCQHRWQDILTNFGVPENLLTKRHQACPFCQAGKDRFRWTDHMGSGGFICSQCGSGDGFDFLEKFTGKSFKEIAGEIRKIIGATTAKPANNTDVSKVRAKLVKIWRDAKPLSKNCPTHRYLHNRGIRVDFGSLTGIRCHPGLDYWHVEDEKPEKLGTFPAMVGAVTTPEGNPATIHCTYITPDGRKAAVDPVRKLMTPSRRWNGGAVRLQTLKPNQVLCVAEGIETALSLQTLHPDVCAWACISAGNLEDFVAPGDASTIYIGSDNDESFTGQAASFALAKKLMTKKHKVRVLMPAHMGTDWNDALITKQKAA